MTVTAHIDVSTAKGRKLVRDLEKNKKLVKIDNPLPLGEDGLPVETYSVVEAFDNLYDKLEDDYGIDLRKL
jgi:hypothetical protein